jgi:dolichol kinase
MRMEFERQVMHLLVGVGAIAMLFLLGRPFTAATVFFVLLAGTLIVNLKINGMKIFFVQWFIERFERRDALFPGFGSACYATGVLIPLVFLTDINEVAACIIVLAIGDGLSTLVGRKGRIKLPYNRKKTAEGAAAFFGGSLAAVLFVGAGALPLAVVAAIVETIDFRIDDNITVPVACTLFFLVV